MIQILAEWFALSTDVRVSKRYLVKHYQQFILCFHDVQTYVHSFTYLFLPSTQRNIEKKGYLITEIMMAKMYNQGSIYRDCDIISLGLTGIEVNMGKLQGH